MNPLLTPSLHETALGCFLHDIGKLLQRAGGAQKNLPAEIQARASDILPSSPNGKGRHTHIHALWSDLFFHEHPNIFPEGVNADRVRRVAVYHHNPDSAASELCAMADRCASGMDRKAKDEEAEPTLQGPSGWDAFIKTPLDSCYASVQLPGIEPVAALQMPLEIFDPATPPFPIKYDGTKTEQLPAQYRKLRDRFNAEVKSLAGVSLGIPVFCETLISLSERYLSAVPSSTKDQPDISLHDHARATAAVGAALYGFHQAEGTLDDRASIRDADRKKFVWVAGDLSGIQNSLFLLASQQVRGVNKILRARSFLIAMLLEAALLECRRTLGLTVFSALQNAGGRFLILAPNVPGVADAVTGVRRLFEGWLWERYTGEIALNLAVSEPFAPRDLRLDRFGQTIGLSEVALGRAKLQAFSDIREPIHTLNFPHGECKACGVRPGVELRGEGDYRCHACDDEERLGRDLPHLYAAAWTRTRESGDGRRIEFPGGLNLRWFREPPLNTRGFESFFRIPDASNVGSPAAEKSVLPLRFLANYVPRLSAGERDSRRYRNLSEESAETRPGEVKTFEHLAQDSMAEDPENPDELLGQPMLAVLKADVDRLGMIFACGIQNPSLGRTAAVSRLTDFFFTGYLTSVLSKDFANIYTVYAGGDDLLLIGPWDQTIVLAQRLRHDFGRWTGNNRSATISAAVELMKLNHPINRVAAAAEERLKRAKDAGRDRIDLIGDEPLDWSEFHAQLQDSEKLSDFIRDGTLTQAFVYRLLYFAEERKKAEGTNLKDLSSANWRARWGYHLARNLDPKKEKNREAVVFVNKLLGLTDSLAHAGRKQAAPRVAVSIAVYRNRSGKEKGNS